MDIFKLRKIVQYAYYHTAFYKQLYDSFNIDIINFDSIETLPVVRPQDLIDFPYDFKSDEPLYKTVMTSGSVSQPKILFRTISDFEKSVQNECLFLKWAGITSKDIVCIVQPFGINGYGELTLEACKKMGIFAIPLGNANNKEIVSAIEIFSPTVLDISPSRLFTFLQTYKKQDYQIRLAMTAGESITPSFKSKIKKKYGIDIINQYGSTELDCLAAEIVGKEGLHMVQDSYIFETLNHQLIVTSLYHKGTPLIRYQLGDLVEISNETISILGRPSSITLYDGIILESFQINKVIRKYNGLFWQCLIYWKNKILCVNLRVIDVSKENIDSIKEEFIDSQDFSDLIKSGEIIFSCQVVSSFIGNSRKKKDFIDARSCTDTMRIQLIQNRCFEAFYFSLPPTTTKFLETFVFQLGKVDLETLIDLGFYVIHFWTQKARKLGQVILQYCYQKNSEYTLKKSLLQASSPDWEIREEAAKIISIIINNQFPSFPVWIQNNISSKDENIRRAFLVAIKYSVEYTNDAIIHEKLLNFMDFYIHDKSKYVKKSFASFTIGDGFLNMCPNLVEKKIDQWLKINDNHVQCSIIRIFKSSGGIKTWPLAEKYLSIFVNNPDYSIQKALKATNQYLNQRIKKEK